MKENQNNPKQTEKQEGTVKVNWVKVIYSAVQIFLFKHVAVMLILNVMALYDIWLRDPIFHHYAVYLLRLSEAFLIFELGAKVWKRKSRLRHIFVEAFSRNMFLFFLFKHKLTPSIVHNVFIPLTILELLKYYSWLIDEKTLKIRKIRKILRTPLAFIEMVGVIRSIESLRSSNSLSDDKADIFLGITSFLFAIQIVFFFKEEIKSRLSKKTDEKIKTN